MLQEDQQRCRGGGRFLKKLKLKKIPQRGLGVSRLEKIRLKEQQQNGVASLPLISVPLSHHHHQSSSSTLFSAPSPTDLSPSSASHRPSSSISLSNLDLFGSSSPLPRTIIYGYNGSDPSGGGCCTTTTWNSCTNMNASSLTSSSSGLNHQMVPPSNQRYYSNYTPPLWPEEEKMVGMKRSWPFSLENPLGSSSHRKFLPAVPPICAMNESSLHRNSTTFNFEQGNAIFREGTSGSTPIHVDWRGGSSELNLKKGGSIENGS